MKIRLYYPDNEVTNSFMPVLWMFLPKPLTPPHYEADTPWHGWPGGAIVVATRLNPLEMRRC